MSEPVQCMTCALFTLKGSELARHGFGNCQKKREPWLYVSMARPHECAWHVPGKPEDVEARRQWLAKKRSTAA